MVNKPTHHVYHVKDVSGDDGKPRSVWLKVGAGWPHQDARGLSLVLDVFPIDGRLVVRTAVSVDSTVEDAEANTTMGDATF